MSTTSSREHIVPRRLPTTAAESADSNILSVVGAAGDALTRSIVEEPGYPSYADCTLGQERCASLYLDITNRAIGRSGIRSQAAQLWDACKDDTDRQDATGKALAGMLANASTSPQRLAVLTFLQGFEAQALSPTNYRDLVRRPLAEGRLLARRHINVPVPSAEIAQEFVSLAMSSDTRARREAIRALGHESTARELYSALTSAPLEPSDWLNVATAIRTCGAPCLDSLEYILSLDDKGARLTLYEQLVFANDDDRPVLARPLLLNRVDEQEAQLRSHYLN